MAKGKRIMGLLKEDFEVGAVTGGYYYKKKRGT
jgi:hypothetical protein